MLMQYLQIEAKLRLSSSCFVPLVGITEYARITGDSCSPVTLREIEQGLILIADLLSFRNHFPVLKIFGNILSWQIGNLTNLIFFQ